MTSFALKFSAALVGVAMLGATASTPAEARCGVGCGVGFGVVGGLIAGAAIASQPARPAPIYVEPHYVRPGYAYYERPVYEDCRRIRWQDRYGAWHRAYECTEN